MPKKHTCRRRLNRARAPSTKSSPSSAADQQLPAEEDGSGAAQSHHQSNGHDLPTLDKMRWVQMGGMLAAIIIIPTICTAAFCITRSPSCFIPCSILIPPIWRLSGRVTAFLFPLDARDFQLEIAKVFKMHRGRPAP